MVDYDRIDDEASRIDPLDPAYEGVNYFIAHATDNACLSNGYYFDRTLAVQSLICMLAFSDSAYRTPEVVAWFAARGITA